MRRKRISIMILLAAFLLSAWGNVIGAAFCPRYLSQHCFAHLTQQANQVERESCHHEIADMDVGDMQMDDSQMDSDSAPKAELESVAEVQPTAGVLESSIERAAFDLPTEPCGHCWMHSQPSSGMGTLAAINPSPRSVEALAPPAEVTIALGFPNPNATEPSEHSPPGSSFPRHILINVFRI